MKWNMNDIKYPYGSVYFVDYSDDIKKICARTGLQPLSAPEDAVLHKEDLNYEEIEVKTRSYK